MVISHNYDLVSIFIEYTCFYDTCFYMNARFNRNWDEGFWWFLSHNLFRYYGVLSGKYDRNAVLFPRFLLIVLVKTINFSPESYEYPETRKGDAYPASDI